MSHPRNQLKRQHAPGIWEDMEGGIHFAIPDILDFFGLPNTPEMRQEAMDMCMGLLREMRHTGAVNIQRRGYCPCGGNVRVTDAEEKSYGDFHCNTCGNYLKESELKR